MMFWIVAIALLAAALAFTVWPLLRASAARPRDDFDGRKSMISALYRDRVTELDAEAAAGQIDVELREQVVEELGASLLDDYRAAEAATGGAAPPGVTVNDQTVAATGPSPGARRWSAWAMLVLLPVAAVLVYLSVGEPDGARLAGATEVLRLDPHTQRDELLAWSERLARRVEQRPDDAQSGYLLGISRLQTGQFAGAAEAFARVHALLGDDGNVTLYWLQSSYLAAGGRLDEATRRIAEMVLESQPGQPLVLEMLAIDAYRKGEYRDAVEHLNRALNNPVSTPQLASLLEGLAEARSRMGDLQPTIDVDVPVPEGAPRDGTLFVIARPPGGGMPYAVVRRPADLLPVSVRLDDTVSMSQDLRLSAAAQIEVVVRLSRSGMPTAHPGDWEWQSEVLQVAALGSPLRLTAVLQPQAAAAAAAPVSGGTARAPAVGPGGRTVN
jgi:cytochrome c-type biogenesis protein CcmH